MFLVIFPGLHYSREDNIADAFFPFTDIAFSCSAFRFHLPFSLLGLFLYYLKWIYPSYLR